MGIAMDEAALAAFLEREFPQTSGDFVIERVAEMSIRVRMPVAERHLRPGGTVSGPSMFALADVSVYLASPGDDRAQGAGRDDELLHRFHAQTGGGGGHDLRVPPAEAGARAGGGGMPAVLRGRAAPVARASMTYSIPPER
jgi:acyl-coenzyme A thioesterase PaaI-like protein